MPALFKPLSAIDTPFDATNQSERLIDKLDSPSGKFSIRERIPEAAGIHNVSLNMNSEEFILFEEFLNSIRGRWKVFWLPSFQEDLVLAEPVADIDATITIAYCGYTDFAFPQENMRHLGFITHPGPLIYHRYVTGSVNNGDGTETLTLNAPLDIAFVPSMNKYVSFLWHCRLEEDTVKFEWEHSDYVTTSFQVREVVNGIPSEVPTPPGCDDCEPWCIPGILWNETWDYPPVVNSPAVLAVWPATASNAFGSFIVEGNELVITAEAGGLFAGSIRHRRSMAVPSGFYKCTGTCRIVTASSPFPGASIDVNGTPVAAASTEGQSDSGDATVEVTDGTINVDLEVFLVAVASVNTFAFGAITLERVCP